MGWTLKKQIKKIEGGAKKHGGFINAASVQVQKQAEKIEGGAKKHGGLGNALVAQLDKTAREVDQSLGNISHLKSSDDDKRKLKENELKDFAHNVTDGFLYPGRAAAEEQEEVPIIGDMVDSTE